jgi:GNAT superfamily N-acetyltransferase
MTDAYHIRLAALDDVAVMVQHRRLMFEAMGKAGDPGFEPMLVAFEDWARRLVPRGEYVHWCIDDAVGHNVGGGGMHIHNWIPKPDDLTARRGYIANVYVDPAHRRQGLARRLLGVILDWSRAQGLQHVALHASEMGRPLYLDLGFKADGVYLLALHRD